MKKVLFVATVTGHINSFHLPYLKLFKENNWETHVVSGDNKEVDNYCEKKHQICILRNPFKIKNIKAIKELKIIIEKEKFDIIHCHTPMGGVIARLAAKKSRKKGTKVLYTAHGFHFYKGAPMKNWLLFYPVEKYLSKYTDILITINKEDYNLAKNKFSKRCKNIEYVPGVGINTEKFNVKMTEKEKENFKKSLGFKEDDFIMLFPARLDKNKNQIFLINVMKILVKGKKNNNIHLLLPGRDELNGYYQNIVKKEQLENHIHFLGYRKDIPQLLNISNIAVSSSLREGLPVNIMEALYYKKPVIALKCRGMEDLIENGKNGYIVNNEEEFVECIKKRNKPKNNINLDSKFTIEEVLSTMKKIYKEDF